MTYVEGFIVAVPTANKEVYRQHALGAWPMFSEFGMTRLVEGWGDDVPDGKVTDFKGAVQAKPDETVLFSWCEYPSRAVRDAGMQAVMDDPLCPKDMPFDGQRVIYGGFRVLVHA